MNRLPSSRRAAKRVIAVLAMGIFAMTAVVLLRDQGRAGADEVSLTLNRRCHFYGAQWGDFDIPLSTNDSPDTAEPGGQVSLSITTGLPTTELEAIVIGARGSFTIPTGLTLQDVTFADTPGTTANFTGSYTTSGNTFVLHYAADGGGCCWLTACCPPPRPPSP